MNPPEKYIFLPFKTQRYYIPMYVEPTYRIKNPEDLVYPKPMIVAKYEFLGDTHKGYIYEYDGLEVR